MAVKENPQFVGVTLDEAVNAIEKECPGTVVHIGTQDGSAWVFVGNYAEYKREMKNIDKREQEDLENNLKKKANKYTYMMGEMTFERPDGGKSISRKPGETAEEFSERILKMSERWKMKAIRMWNALCEEADWFKRELKLAEDILTDKELSILEKKADAAGQMKETARTALDCYRTAGIYNTNARQVVRPDKEIPQLQERLRNRKPFGGRKILECYDSILDPGVNIIVDGYESGGYWNQEEYDKARKGKP